MRKLFFLFLPLFLFSNGIVFNSKIYVNNDFIPDYELFKGWKTYYKKTGTNLAILYDNENIETEYKNFVLGAFREDFYFLKSNQDTAEFSYLLFSKGNIKNNKKYNLYINLYGYSIRGMKLGKIFSFNNLKIFPSFDLFQGQHMQDGAVKGSAVTYANGDYHYTAKANYFYTHNYLYKLKVNQPSAWGYRINLKINYKNKNFSFFANIKNLMGTIYWKNLPYSNVVLNTDNKDKSKGYLIYKPTMTGVEKYVDKNQNLYPLSNFYVGVVNKYVDKIIVGSQMYRKYYFPYLGFKKNNYKFLYDLRFKSVKVFYKLKHLSLFLQTNKINPKKANSFGFGLSYHLSF